MGGGAGHHFGPDSRERSASFRAITPKPSSVQLTPDPGAQAGSGGNLAARVWRNAKDFAGAAGDATYLWPRWLVLRAVGLVYVIIFVGVIRDAAVLIGPEGLTPLAQFFELHRAKHPGLVDAFLHAPSLFWINHGAGMIAGLAWVGLAAAVALVLNLWPRLALFACWLCFLSFVATWGIFSGSQVDVLMLETALVCLAFAPAGYRPGLGAASPPRPIAVFMMRWLIFRIMLESGIVKVITGDAHWRDLTAMDLMYETSPFPTILGYLDHQLPHGYHLFEVMLTYVAEFVAPVLAVLAGRRGRWIAFVIWVMFQAGIQLTNNFGWLNTSAIALGLLLLDDQMLASAAARLRLPRLGAFLAAKAVRLPAPPLARWKLNSLRTALWVHFGLTLYFFGMVFGMPVTEFPYVLARPLVFVVEGFRSANPFTLYARVAPARYAVEFHGSNDGGRTWRPYEYWYQPQRTDRIGPFIAPWYPRFEATLQIESTSKPPSALYRLVAAHLLAADPAVVGLFRNNPFPGSGPTLLRMPTYRVRFTDAATRRATGNFWQKDYEDEYLPMMYVDATGRIVATESVTDQVRVLAGLGNPQAQGQLASMYANGEGVEQDSAKAFQWFRKAAEQGVPEAQNVVGLMYAAGNGTARNAVEALVWFNLAARAGHGDAMRNRELAESMVSRAEASAARLRSEVLAAEIDAKR